MRAAFFDTKINKIEDLGVQDTRNFDLRFADGDHFEFKAGQFVNVILEPAPDKKVKRPYSIASSPHWSGRIDLCWKRVDGGEATNILWDYKEGDVLKIQGPLGHFTLKEPLAKHIAFVSTGTGVAPFRAMIHELFKREAPVEIYNIFGNRYETDILYKSEFEELESKHSNFHNVFTVSRPDKWAGEKAYVQDLLAKHLKDPENTQVYICGLSSMITAVEQKALELGIKKESIYFEKYD